MKDDISLKFGSEEQGDYNKLNQYINSKSIGTKLLTNGSQWSMGGGYYLHSYRRRLVVFSEYHEFVYTEDCRKVHRYTNGKRVGHQGFTTSVKKLRNQQGESFITFSVKIPRW